MTATLTATERAVAPKTIDELQVTEREAREVGEAARETEWTSSSFLKELFGGNLRLDLIHPYPSADSEKEARARPFMRRLEALLRRVDGDQIEREQGIPDDIVDELKRIGAFGIKISTKYGALGLSQRSYVEAIGEVASVDGSLTALLSAHQPIGLPQPLKLFGTAVQKEQYFPRLAQGAISAFALTEQHAGSDPAKMTTTTELTDDGDAYILNGEKLWITNGLRKN